MVETRRQLNSRTVNICFLSFPDVGDKIMLQATDTELHLTSKREGGLAHAAYC